MLATNDLFGRAGAALSFGFFAAVVADAARHLHKFATKQIQTLFINIQSFHIFSLIFPHQQQAQQQQKCNRK